MNDRPSSSPRRLAAIMFTDMVGYSALTQRDEALALELLGEHNRLIRAGLAAHQGREIKTVGDAFLAEFDSALEAVRCAMRIQLDLARRNAAGQVEPINIRVGIHLGDVVYLESDVFGDGVNIAARVQSSAEAGEIRLSEDVARQVMNKIEPKLRDLGVIALKNISQPVRIYAVEGFGSPDVVAPTSGGTADPYAAGPACLDRDDTPTNGVNNEQDDPLPARPAQPASSVHQPRTPRSPIIFTISAVVVTAGAAAAWFAIEHNRKQTFVAASLPKIESLSRSTKYMEAFRLAQEVERAGGGALLTEVIKETYTRAIDINSTPEGAAIAYREYRPDTNEPAWIGLGKTPMTQVRVPRGVLEWRALLPQRGTHTLVASIMGGGWTQYFDNLAFSLPAADAKDADILPVSEGQISVSAIAGLVVAQNVKLPAFAIDRTEVTNRQYAQFVQAGGYTREEYWKHPFRDGARILSFADAMARFKDATGRSGPATWKLGGFPDGEADLPVRGISWHEASAYAAFAGKTLPTLYHWFFADSGNDFSMLMSALLPSANLAASGQNAGPRRAANSRTISRFGAVDMAGNVREWVSTPTDQGHHVAVGGSWLEMNYQYKHGTPYSAFDRPVDVGFRCMSTPIAIGTGDPAYAAVVEKTRRDPRAITPVSDAEYAIYTRFYEQSRVPLDVRIEATDDSKPHWTRIKANFAAGYGDERMNAYLYLPKNAAPPFQTVIHFPGSGVFGNNQPYDDIAETPATNWQTVEILVRAGRAVLYPVWKGSFERSTQSRWTSPGVYYRARLTNWASELRQSVEFLRSRGEVAADGIGYLGYSLGAMWAPNLLAMEPRIKAAVLIAGGIDQVFSNGETMPPEIATSTFAPRVKIPVLMLNGRSDIRFPYETSQAPLFSLLGSPPGKKLHKTYPGGHSLLGWYDEMAREILNWFDEQFAPVRPVGTK